MPPTIAEPMELAKNAQDLLFREARTANAFTDEPVSDAQVRAIHDLVKYGPTSMNIQPLRITLLRTPESRERLVRHLAEGNRAKTRGAPLTALLSFDTEFHEKADTFFPERADTVRGAFADPDRRDGAGRLNAALQAAYFIIGVRAAGLAAGPMSGFDHQAMDAEFFPEGTQHAFLVVNIGQPAENAWFDRLPRLSYEDTVTEL